MTKCSIVPQVFNSTKYVDSELFKAINSRLSSEYSGTELRNKTKELYDKYNSDVFKESFGDWTLYQHLKFNTASEKELIKFNTLYKGDIKLLEKSINLGTLNSLYEPEFITKGDMTENKAYFNVSDIDGKPIISFESESKFKEFINDFGSPEVAISNLLKTKNIHFKLENKYITNNPNERVAVASNSYFASYGSIFSISESNKKFDEQVVSTASRNISSMGEVYDNTDVQFINRFVSAIVLSNIDEFEKRFNTKNKRNISSIIQQREIDNFIKSKVLNFRDNYVASIDKAIENERNEITKRNLETKRELIYKQYTDLSDKLFERDLTTNTRNIYYNTLLAHLKSKFSITIANESSTISISEEDTEGNRVDIEMSQAHFGGKEAFKIDQKRNVMQEVKFALARSMATTFMSDSIKSSQTESKWGIQEPLEIDDVWSMFISVASTTYTKAQTLTVLSSINNNQFSGRLSNFIEQLSTDENLWNGFYASVNLPVISNKTLIITNKPNGNIILSETENNYNAKAENIAYEQLYVPLQIQLENNPSYLYNILTDKENGYDKDLTVQKNIDKTIKDLSHRADDRTKIKRYSDWIIKRLEALGLNSITINDINQTILVKNGRGDVVDRFNISTNLDDQLVSSFINSYTDLIKHLTYLTNDIYNVQLKYEKTSDDKKKFFRFRDKFNQKDTLRTLAKYGSLKLFNSVNLSYMNEEGEMEHSGQKPFYLSDFLKKLNIDKDNFDAESIQEQLSEFINSPAMQHNEFLYNLDGDGYGLFNVIKVGDGYKKNPNGSLAINPYTPINTNFIKNFKYKQLGGEKNTNTSKGIPYDKITDDSFTLVGIASMLKGIWVTPSSDASRAYEIHMPKYGLQGIYTDNAGYFKSLRSVLVDCGLIAKETYIDGNGKEVIKGSIIRRTLSDINDNSKIFFPAFMVDGVISEQSVKTLGELKDIINNPKYVDNTTVNLLENILANFNAAIEQKFLETYIDYSFNADFIKAKQIKAKATQSGIYRAIPYHSLVGSESVNKAYDLLKAKKAVSLELADEAIQDVLVYLSGLDRALLAGGKEHYIYNLNNIRDRFKFDGILGVSDIATLDFSDNLTKVMLGRQIQSSAAKYINNPSLILENDESIIKEYTAYKKIKVYKSLQRLVEAEVYIMQQASKSLFTYTYDVTKNGVKHISKLSVKPEMQKKADEGRLHDVKDYTKRTDVKFDSNGKELPTKAIILDSNNNPTGRAFNFNRLTFTKDGKLQTLFTYAKAYLGKSATKSDLVSLVARMSKDTHPEVVNNSKVIPHSEYEKLKGKAAIGFISEIALERDIARAKTIFENIYSDFIEDYLHYTQKSYVERNKNIENEIKMMLTSTPAYVPGTAKSKVETIVGKSKGFVISTHNTIKETEEQIEATSGEEVSRINNPLVHREYVKSMLEVIINNNIMTANVGEDLLYGRQYEYKNTQDMNKRVSEIIRNGTTVNDIKTYSSLTCDDIWTVSNMLEDMVKNGKMDKDYVLKNFGKAIEVGNGFSFITVNEFIVRAKATNHYERLKPYIDALTDKTKTFDPDAYYHIVEQLKYFMYSRQINNDGTTPGNVESYQEKNSTMVLFPKMFANTEYEAIINFMNEHGIDQINFKSGSKLSVPLFKLHDVYSDKILDKELPSKYVLRTTRKNGLNTIAVPEGVRVSDYIVAYKRNNLRIQQEQVSHTLEMSGKLSTQANKKIDVNLNPNAEFDVIYGYENGKPVASKYKGKTGNYADGKRGIFENRHSALHFNLREDRDRLIYSWGAIKDGKIQRDFDGNILVDVAKMYDTVYRYYANTADSALMAAFSPLRDRTQSVMSLNHPLIKNTIEAIFQAAITRNVNIELPQIHGTIIPDSFIRPAVSEFNKTGILGVDDLDNYDKTGGISYTKEFRDSMEGKHISEWELKAESYDSEGNVIPAQIVLNIWDKRFEKYAYYENILVNGKPSLARKIDIDRIPKESRLVYWTRIPHEGMQSSGVAEVVGFMNNQASQIIVPKHASARTGWDYDIDSLYIYTKHLYERTDSDGVTRLYPISYEYDTTHKEGIHNTDYNKRLNFIKTYFLNDYNAILDFKRIETNKARSEYKLKLDTKASALKKEVVEMLKQIKKDVNNPEYADKIKTIRDILGDYVSNSKEVINKFYSLANTNFNSVYNQLLDNLEVLLDDYFETDNIESISEYLDENTISSSKTRNLLAELSAQEIEVDNKALKEEFLDTIDSITKEYKKKLTELFFSSEVTELYNSLPELQKMTRETRDNMVVDSLIAVTMSKHSNEFREKINEFNTLNKVSESINDKMNLDNSNLNFLDLLDRFQITSANKNIAQLKGIAIQNQNTYSLLGVVNASTTEKFLVPVVITTKEFETDDTYTQQRILDSNFGRDNWQAVKDDEGNITKYIVFNSYLGNNASGNWKNIHGRYITEQASEIAANVLDAVKYPMGFNIGIHTEGVLDLLANTPMSHVTDIYSASKAANSFVYSNLVIHQAIIKKFVDTINNNTRNGKLADKNNVFKIVTNDAKIDVIKNLAKINAVSGRLEKGINDFSILHVFAYHLSNLPVDSEIKAKISKLETWIKNIRNNETLYMAGSYTVNGTTMYSELIDFIGNTNLKSIILSYIENEVSAKDRSEAYDKFEKSDLATRLNALNVSGQDYTNVYAKTDKGLIVFDEKAVLSLEELKDLYESGIEKGFYKMDKTSFKNLDNILDYIEFLDSQMSIMKLYQQYDKVANLVSKASLVLKTDKLGTSPDSFTTLKLNEDMVALHLDYSEFDEQLSKAGFSSRERKLIKQEFDKADNIPAKKEVLEKVISEYNAGEPKVSINSAGDSIVYSKIKLEIPTSGLRVGSKSLLESVFPNVVNNTLEDEGDNKYDFTKSSLPLFESQYVNNYYFSTKSFSRLLFSSSPYMTRLLKGVTAELGITGNMYNSNSKKVYKRILDSIISDYIYNEVPFLNGGHADENLRALEVRRVIGSTDKVITDSRDLSLAEYRQLSVANQIFLLNMNIHKFQTKYRISELEDINSVLELFKPKIGIPDITKNGYHALVMTNTSKDIEQLRRIFRSMFFNTNPFIRQTARDLIRYSFHFYGLNWGMNVSKIIDPAIMWERSSEYDTIVDNTFSSKVNGYNQYDTLVEEDSVDINRVYKINEALHKLASEIDITLTDSQFDEEVKRHATRIKSQLYDDNTVSPVVTQFGTKMTLPADMRSPNFKYDRTNEYPILIEEAAKVENSYYGKYNYLKTNIKLEQGNTRLAFEKYQPENSTKVYYFPINKALPYESTDIEITRSVGEDVETESLNTVVQAYTSNVHSDIYYKELIDAYDVKYNSKEPKRNISNLYPVDRVIESDANAQPVTSEVYSYFTEITKSEKVHSETAKDIIDSVDKVIYIGDNQIYRNNFKSEKTVYFSLDEIGVKAFNSLDLNHTDKIAIVGDSISDNTLNQKQYDDAIISFVRNIMYYYEFDSLKTIFKRGVGESVYKASFTSNKPNEYIEVGTKDVVRNISDLGQIDGNVLGSSHLSLNNFADNFITTFRNVRGLQGELSQMLDSKSDVFKFKQQEIIDIIADATSENFMDDIDNKLESLRAAMRANVETIDTILNYIYNDVIRFKHSDGTVDEVRILNLNIQKYVRSDNTAHKVLIAEKLLTYNKMISIANNVLNTQMLSVPNINNPEFEALPENQRQAIIKFRNFTFEFSKTIQRLRQDRPVVLEDASLLNMEHLSRQGLKDKLELELTNKVKEYMVANVNNYTRNRKFGDLTDFGKLNKAIKENRLTDDDFIFNMSANEMSKLYTALMKYNDDISRGQLLMDSIRTTGISLIDNMFMLISEIRFDVNAKRDNRVVELRSILSKFEGFKNNDSLKYDNSKRRSNLIRDRFIDKDTGKFISEFNWEDYNRDYKKRVREIAEYSDIYKAYASNSNFDLVSYFQFKDKTIVSERVSTKESKISANPNNKLETITVHLHNKIVAHLNNPTNTNITKSLDEIKSAMQSNLIKSEGGYNYYKYADVQVSEDTKDSKGARYEIIFRIPSDFRTDFEFSIINSKDIFIKTDKETISISQLKYKTNKIVADEYRKDDKYEEGVLAGKYELDPLNPTKEGDDTLYKQLLATYLEKGYYANAEQKSDFERRYHIVIDDNVLYNSTTGKDIFRKTNVLDSKYREKGEDYYTGTYPIKIYKVIPKTEYQSEKYKQLKPNDVEFLNEIKNYIQRIVNDTFPNMILAENFAPYIFLNSTKDIGSMFKQLIGWRDIQKENIALDTFGNTKHIFQSRYLVEPKVKNIIKISQKKYEESELEYQTRVVKEANEALNKLRIRKDLKHELSNFNSYAEVIEYNSMITQEFIKETSSRYNYDIPSVLFELTEELYNIKSYSEFKKVYELLVNLMSKDEFETRDRSLSGKLKTDQIKARLTGETSYVTTKGERTRATQALLAANNRLSKVSRTNNLFDQILGSAVRLTSMNTMWFNFHTGVKNVMKGISDLFIEYNGGEFANRKEFGWAINKYRTNISAIISSMYSKDVAEVSGLVPGLIKHFGSIYEDHTEGHINRETRDSFNKFLNLTEVGGYFPTIAGEHFLQYITLLALLKSHRLVGGFVMSRNEFMAQERYDMYYKHLTKELKEELDAYIKDRRKEEVDTNGNKKVSQDNYKFTDHTARWAYLNGNKFTPELRKTLDNELKSFEKEALAKFEGVVNPTTKKREGGFKTLLEYYTFVETEKGIGKIVVDPKITKIIETQFVDRVRALNHSIHGVYNTIDRTKIQDAMWGEMVLQFRKWIMPTWYRWMGVRFSLNPLNIDNNQPFSEQLNQYRSGAFTDTFNFLRQPFIREYLKGKQEHLKNPAVHALFSSFLGYAHYFKNIAFYYNQLNPHEKANVRRTATLVLNLFVITAALFGVSAFYDDDEEDDSFFKPKGSSILLLSGLQTEYLELLPVYGWSVFYKRTKQNIVPAERFLVSLSTLLYDTFAYPFRDDEERKHKRGQYADEDRVKVGLYKTLPIARQLHKQFYLGSHIQYFEMNNKFAKNPFVDND